MDYLNRFVHKTHYGFYVWPKVMQVYAPEEEQPPLIRSSEAYTPGETELRSFFNNPSKVEKLVYFFSLEDRKGKDRFDATRFSLFKGKEGPLTSIFSWITIYHFDVVA